MAMVVNHKVSGCDERPEVMVLSKSHWAWVSKPTRGTITNSVLASHPDLDNVGHPALYMSLTRSTRQRNLYNPFQAQREWPQKTGGWEKVDTNKSEPRYMPFDKLNRTVMMSI